MQWVRSTVMWRVQVQGQGKVGACQRHPAASPLSWSVVKPGGPSRERAAMYIGKKDLAAKEEVSKQKKKKKK